MKHIFVYHHTDILLKFVGMEIFYLDISNNIKKSRLCGNGNRVWLTDAACSPFADTVKIFLPGF